MLDKYFEDILKTFRGGSATESSFYSDLKNFIEEFTKLKGIIVNITIQPKRTEEGNAPDFVIRRGKELIGYIEAKKLGTNLDKAEDSEQIQRYLKTFPNFIF